MPHRRSHPRHLGSALASLALVSLLAPQPTRAQPGPLAEPGDGIPTEAACRDFGIAPVNPPLPTRPRPAHPIVVTGNRSQATANAAPPAVTLPISPSAKQDRVEYAGPSVIVPGPPPPLVVRSPPPTQPDTERYPNAVPNPVKRTADQPVSTFSIDVDTAAYANVRRFIARNQAPPRDAVRVEELVNYFDYGYARPASASRPFEITTAVTPSPWAEGRQIVHIGLQGYELPDNQRRPLNLTFLVDVSGSMSSADKLDLAKQSMNLIIDRLRPEDRVAVTYYAEGAGTVVGPTSGAEKLKLRCAVAALNARGGTAGATGMTNAYDQAEASLGRDRVNRILMFTDGDFNVGVTDDKRLEDYVADKRKSGIYLSVYGYGRGNYQDARMQTIAQSGNGIAAYVDNLDEARRLFGPRFDQGAFPIADDVKIQVEFNPARVAEWRLVGYETRLLDEADFNNDAVDAGEVGSGASVTALYEITPVGGPLQIAERRYRDNRIGRGGGDPSGEVGFIQVRYKLPGQDRSDLIQKPLATSPDSAGPDESTRWAMAVAAFGQKLRQDPWMSPTYDWDQVLALAQGARGTDDYGERAQFVQLVRAASSLPPRPRP